MALGNSFRETPGGVIGATYQIKWRSNMLDVLNETSTGGGYLSWGSQKNSWNVDGETCALTKMLIDPQSLKTGFGKIEKGVAPDYVWAEIAGTKIERPSPDHKPAFSVNTFVATKYGAPLDGEREWSANSAASKMAVQKFWEELHNDAATNPGKWAVIELAGSEPKNAGQAIINVPIMKLAGWADKPAVAEPAPQPMPVQEAVAAADAF